MALQADQQNRGIWTNPDWVEGTAGTFAVVIGVSRYKYLRDGAGDDGHGSNLAPENYDLGQLPVSALTATRFFEWLRDHYGIEKAPLAKCWLLLAPSKDEETVYGGPLPESAEPTLDECKDAIEEMYAAAKALPAAAAEASRLLFFFSGHGIQIQRDKQLLLPCDYLSPPAHSANQALSTSNLSIGMESLPPKHQYFFVDACRNDHERLRLNANLEGLRFLDEKVSRLATDPLVGPIFYATGSGSAALSPAAPGDGISYFGQALLEGLQLQGEFQADCDAELCRVMVHKLGPFLERRVSALVPVRGSGVAVTTGGVVREGVITELQQTDAYVPVAAGHPPPKLMKLNLPSNWLPGDKPGEILNLVGNEFATAFFLKAEAVPLEGGRDRAASKPVIHRVDRTPDNELYRVELSVPRGAHWLQFVDDYLKAPRTYACVLPGDAASTPRYRLDWSTEIVDRVGVITRLEAKLSSSNDGPLGQAAALWELYQAVDLAGALKSKDLQDLEETLKAKVESPLAAVVAGTILLRLREHALLHDWLRNLAIWFKDVPDGPVLYAEQLLQTKAGAIESEDFLNSVLELGTRGLPHTSEAFGYADKHVSRLLQVMPPKAAERRRELEALRGQIDNALRYFRSGGLFAVFMGDSAAVTQDLIAPLAVGAAN